MTDPTVETVIAPGPKARLARAIERGNQVKIAMIAATLILTVGVLVGNGILAARVATLEDQGTRAACSDRLMADFAGAVGRALAAPPAPNPERAAAVADMRRASARLSRSDRVCVDGVPRPLVPTVVSPPATGAGPEPVPPQAAGPVQPDPLTLDAPSQPGPPPPEVVAEEQRRGERRGQTTSTTTTSRPSRRLCLPIVGCLE